MSPHLRHVSLPHLFLLHRHQDQFNPSIITESNVDLFLGSSQPGDGIVESPIDSTEPITSAAAHLTQERPRSISSANNIQGQPLLQRRASFSSIRTTTSIISVPPPPYSEIEPPPAQYEWLSLDQPRNPTQTRRPPPVVPGNPSAAATARAHSIAGTNAATSHSAYFGLLSDNDEPESSRSSGRRRRSNPPGAPLRNSVPTIVDAVRARNSNPALHYMEYAANQRSDLSLMGNFRITGKATLSGFRTQRR